MGREIHDEILVKDSETLYDLERRMDECGERGWLTAGEYDLLLSTRKALRADTLAPNELRRRADALYERAHEAAMRTRYHVCERCAHVEPVPGYDDRPTRCEDCGHSDVAAFDDHDQALDHSELVLERNEAYDRTRRGEMQGGW
jgi:hypothetical protein